jgi:hypothetical protein
MSCVQLATVPSTAQTLFSSVRKLAAPGSWLYFDFLHLGALQGRVSPLGYRTTAMVCLAPLTLVSCTVLRFLYKPYMHQNAALS